MIEIVRSSSGSNKVAALATFLKVAAAAAVYGGKRCCLFFFLGCVAVENSFIFSFLGRVAVEKVSLSWVLEKNLFAFFSFLGCWRGGKRC
jgi:hypothetical protein